MEIKISKKKPSFKISKNFENYLKEHNRFQKIPIEYSDLRRYTGSVELFDRNDENTLWHRVFYNDSERIEIDQNLKLVYNLLYSDGSSSNLDDLEIDSVDFFHEDPDISDFLFSCSYSYWDVKARRPQVVLL